MSLLTSLTDPAFDGGLHVRASVEDRTTRLVVSGEVDFADVPDLEEALGRVPLDATDVVHLDLGELTFADSHAVRRLADFARTVRGSGRQFRSTGANWTVRQVATVLGVDAELGLA